ncbi:MAG: hypothetical protein K6G03_09365 [Lachnospiraceae bacterium]|nr:hypothetical protein [Lachnospiraceae bacterium]
MIKKIMIMTVISVFSFSTIVYGRPEFSEATKQLMREAGMRTEECDLNEIMQRQEALKRRKAAASQTNDQISTDHSERTAKSGNDEYRLSEGGGAETVAVTDTDDLHIYSDEYAENYDGAFYGSKNSYDEFHTAPYDIKSNDGYRSGGFDELHINENYRDQVWRPSTKVYRLGIDEFRLPNEM